MSLRGPILHSEYSNEKWYKPKKNKSSVDDWSLLRIISLWSCSKNSETGELFGNFYSEILCLYFNCLAPFRMFYGT